MSLSKKENFMLKMIEQNILELRKIGKRFENEVKLLAELFNANVLRSGS